MLINSHDPCIEINLVENIKEITGLMQFVSGVCFDVGANVGSHTVNFSRQASAVYAFEPHPHTYYHLCANILMNGCYNALPFQYALGARDGYTTVWNIDPRKPNTGMGVECDKGDLVVPMRKIDSLEISPIHFMKIDVEGYEYEVLKGAKETLARESMIVFVEIHEDELIEPVWDLMHETGHKGYEFVHTEYKEIVGTGHTSGFLFYKEGRIVWE